MLWSNDQQQLQLAEGEIVITAQRRRLAERPQQQIGLPVSQRPPVQQGGVQRKVQPGQRLLLIKCSDWRREQRHGKGAVHRQTKAILPPLLQLNRPDLQFSGDMQHLPPFLQQHLSAGGKARAMAAAVEQLNIEIAFQAVNGVAQRRGRFKELCRRRGKAPLFFQGIQDHEDIQQWFHRYPLTVCESPLADHSIGITSGSGYWYSNPSSLQIRLPSTILPWPPSGLSLNTGGGRPSSRAICG